MVILNAMPTARNKEATIRESVRYASRLKLEVAPNWLSELPAYSQGLKSGRGVRESEKNGTAAKEIRALFEALWARDSEEAGV